MPFYDVTRDETTNVSASTSSYHFAAGTLPNQETVSIMGFYAAARIGTAGGAQFRMQGNTGAKYTGGTNQIPTAKNARAAVAAQSSWANDGSAITPGATLGLRVGVGFAQTGGMGGYVPITPGDAIQIMPNSSTAANPTDVEWSTLASAGSVTFTATIEFVEGSN